MNEYLLYFALLIAFAFSFAKIDFYREMQLNYLDQSLSKYFERKWKHWKWIVWFMFYSYIALLQFLDILEIEKLVLLLISSGIYFHLLFDGFLNYFRGRSIFQYSNLTQSRIELFIIKIFGTKKNTHLILRLILFLIATALLIATTVL